MKIAWHMPTLHSHTCGLSIRAIEFAVRLEAQGHGVTFFVDAAKTDFAGDNIRGMRLIRLDIPFRQPLHWSLQAVTRRRRAASAAALVGDAWDLVISCQPEFVVQFARRKNRPPLLYVCGSTTLHHDAANSSTQSAMSLLRRLPYRIDRALKRLNERHAFHAADAAVFDSDQSRELVVSKYGVQPAACHTIRGGVDTYRFALADEEQKGSARQTFNIEDRGCVVAWTGRMSPEKNLPLLLEAAARMRGEDIVFLLVGDGPERPRLERQAETLGLQRTVRFAGSRCDVRPCLRAADVFAFPSRSESFGCSLAEALSCGLPVVALRPNGETVCNTSIEVVEAGGCGLLVDDPSATAYADALTRLCRDAELRQRLGGAARTWAQQYDWDAGATRLSSLLDALAQDRSGAATLRFETTRSADSASPVVG